MIPKVDTPEKVKDFRPISCCNVIYKCISKILVNRIRNHLHKIVDVNQSAFIQGRSITDNILLTQDLLKSYNRKQGAPRIALKVDIQKAYDTVNWNFLRNILHHFGFHPKMVYWLMKCVTTASFSVSINGETHGYFKGGRGLRQGDPISPYLFTVVMEVFNLIFKRTIKTLKTFKFHWRCKKHEITHLCFADDLIIFSHGDVKSVKVIREALLEFQHVSGLVPSEPKSNIFFGNVPDPLKGLILDIIMFAEGVLPIRYLGVPLIQSRLFIRDCYVLIAKVKTKIQNWKNRYLSFAGRLQLINSVLTSMQVYWSSVFLLPKETIRDIEQLMWNYLWGGSIDFKRGKVKVAWVNVCKPKKEGGLGIKSLDRWNVALLSKQIWRLLTSKDSLWVAWAHDYHVKKNSFWNIKKTDRSGWGWTNILNIRDKLRPHLWCEVGNGLNTNAWYDTWHVAGPIGNFISPQEILDGGFSLNTTVNELITNKQWNWPNEWNSKFPNLTTQLPPLIIPNRRDAFKWKSSKGDLKDFTVRDVWIELNGVGVDVPWYKVVWFKTHIPNHAFNLWLAIRDRLSTQDKMHHLNPNSVLLCPFCNNQSDSRDHLFFDCHTPRKIWEHVKTTTGTTIVHHNFRDLLSYFQDYFDANMELEKLLFAATLYFVWTERNFRIFNNVHRDAKTIGDQVVKCIRNRFMGLKVKHSKTNEATLARLKIPRPRGWPSNDSVLL